MVYCYLPVGTPLDKSSECGFYESNSRSRFDNCAQLVLNDLYWWKDSKVMWLCWLNYAYQTVSAKFLLHNTLSKRIHTYAKGVLYYTSLNDKEQICDCNKSYIYLHCLREMSLLFRPFMLHEFWKWVSYFKSSV